MRQLVLIALLAGWAVAAPVPKAVRKKTDDADLLVGTWKPVEGRNEWFEFTPDGKMKAWNTGGSAATGLTYTWTIDPTTDPKSMTLGNTVKQPQWDCIYQLDGDTLRFSYNIAGQRPAKIEPAIGQHYCDLRRDTSAK